MSGIGFWELIFLFLIGLIVLGPERLPRVASQLGSWLGQARRMTRVMRRQLEDELNFEESIRPPPRKALPARPEPESEQGASARPPSEAEHNSSPAQGPHSPGTGPAEPSLEGVEKRGSDEAKDERDAAANPGAAPEEKDGDDSVPQTDEAAPKKVSNSAP
ncbi:MAG: Sec-independent protein translocase protein TatB [Woeseia sp.]